MIQCSHDKIECLNQYEFIRKYRCLQCGGVMMCSCDEYIGKTFLPHQLSEGSILETQERIPVNLGFQSKICDECRGLPIKAYPHGEIYGMTSKVRRYYWREIRFESFRKLGKWAVENNIPLDGIIFRYNNKLDELEKEVVEEFKILHKTKPKYIYEELSQQEIIEKHKVNVISLKAEFLNHTEKKSLIKYKEHELTVEEYVQAYYRELNYNCIETESIPFHVLFGTFLFLLIQDFRDPNLEQNGFGSRTAYERDRSKEMIQTFFPSDFGSKGYGIRRKIDIDEYFKTLPIEKEEVLWTFDYWLPHSNDLREYLWAHRQEHIDKAKEILKILPISTIYEILRYLVDDYWGRYLGWPDLIVYNKKEYFFVEVKGPKDKLSENQKRWIEDNYNILKLPFKIVKIFRN